MSDFGVFLRNIDGGCLLDELGEEQASLVKNLVRRAEQDGDAKGTITLTLKLAAKREKEVVRVKVTPDVKVKAPAPERATGYFFGLPDGELTGKHPRQRELDFTPRVVDGGAKVGEVDNGGEQHDVKVRPPPERKASVREAPAGKVNG